MSRPTSGRKPVIAKVLVGLLTFALGCAWGWVPSLVTLATDGVPASEYEGYNNVGYVLLAVCLMVVLSIVAVVGYLVALRRGRSVWRALLVSQVPCLLGAAAVTALVGGR